MKISPEMEAKGLMAYEQARAFESMQARRLPFIYGGVALLLVVGAGTMFFLGHPFLALGSLVVAVVFPLLSGWQWKRYRERHAENLRLLAELEQQFGEELPWLQVERHFAALEKLEGELTEEKAAEERRKS